MVPEGRVVSGEKRRVSRALLSFYLAARFSDDFESAIPQRFLDGLQDSDVLIGLACALAAGMSG